MRDADPRGHVDVLGRRAVVQNKQRPQGQIAAAQRPGDTHGLGKLSGSVHELAFPAAAFLHHFSAAQRCQSPNQDTSGLTIWLGHDVETFVHAINQVDVGVAWRSEDDSCARGHAF